MNTSIADKLSLFREQNLTADAIIQRENLVDYGVRGLFHSTSPNGIFFEEGIGFDSPSLPSNRTVFFGAHSYMNDGGYTRGNIFIGRYTSIGRRVTIGAGDHYYTGLSTSPKLSGGHAHSAYTLEELDTLDISSKKRKSPLTVIGCDVWIGDGAIIMPGLNIGHGSIIGANAVVIKDVLPYEIVGGIPSKTLRFRFTPQYIEALLASRWWDLPLSDLKSMKLGNILACLESFQDKSREPYIYKTLQLDHRS